MNNFERPRPNFPKRAIVTGGMPYGNKSLHFGHLALMVRADTFARFLRDRIGKENVIFVSGTDCYGSPAVESFRKLKAAGEINDNTLADFVERNHKNQKATFEDYNVSFNYFGASAIGASKEIHDAESADFIQTLHKNGWLSKQSSWQFYDEKYGQFLNGRQVVGKCPIENCQSEKGYADECDLGHQYLPQDLINPISTLSGEKPTLKKIENWYFNLEDCIDILNEWINALERRSDSAAFMIKEVREFFKKPEIYIKKDYKNQVLGLNLPNYTIEGKENAPSFTMVFDKLTDREKACEILSNNGVRYRTGKTLTPFRLTGDLDWGVACPVIDGLDHRTFYVWPESLWAPISFSKTYLKSIGAESDEWKKFWCDKDAEVYQFIGEDNMYFYGPAQQAMWLCTQGAKPTFPAAQGELQTTIIVPIKSLLFMGNKASSSGALKPPSADELLQHYTADQFRMHILGMNLGNNNISFSPNWEQDDSLDPVLKEGNLLTNVYNRVLRTLFYSLQKEFGGVLPRAEIDNEIRESCKTAILNYERFMYDKKFHQVINTVDVFVRNINKYWVKEVTGADTVDKKAKLVANTAELIRVANILLHPISPVGTEKVREYMGMNEKCFDWQYILEDIYFFLSNERKFKTLAEKEDFFKKHQSQLDKLANR